MKKEKISDFSMRITQSNRSQLVVVIYDMTLEYIDEAMEYYGLGKIDEFVETTKKAGACIHELMSALDTKYPIAVELMQLYIYMNKLLIQSAIKREPQDFDAIKRMIGKLSEAFGEVSKGDKSAPLMGNTQQVYAGLTYGKGTLSENYASPETNRGFRV
ncbi:flagellar export chaperone FliS [Konateibacter massiliensis]|uniref:flagellar export chaperone FliS n=1 Tax=Konateibacter massiliensis TaxID=2002841 RepID=UPI000C151F69|nr:flagellar protein FliS [Konateibacter massiliensis]